VISALDTYCKGEDPALARRSAALLIRYVLANLNRSDNETANLVSKALYAIAAAQHPKEAKVLKAVLQSNVKDWSRGVALKRLAELEHEAGILRLQRALSDPRLCEHAARGIAKLARGRTDGPLVDALVTALRGEKRERVRNELVDALVALEADVTTILAENSGQLSPHVVMRVFWQVNGITPRIAAEWLVRAGIIPPPSAESLAQIEQDCEGEPGAGSIFPLLHGAGRLLFFDCETGVFPVDYVDLVDDLMAISRDVFEIEAVSQRSPQDSEGYVVQFVSGDRVYRSTPQDFGDWYAVEAVVSVLNEALSDAGREERFVLLYTGDQTCLVTFAPEEAFRQVAHELCIPLEQDYRAAMDRGIAYEQHVFQYIQQQERAA
jgi:hypothetical protein